MKTTNPLPTIWAYLHERFRFIGLFFSFVLIFLGVFSLYNLPLESILYAFLLCSSLGGLFALWDGWRYIQKHRRLGLLKEEVGLCLEKLPKAQGLLEADYQGLVAVLFEEKTELISMSDQGRQDMLDYYTPWVHQIKNPIAAMGLILQSEEGESFEEIALALLKIEQYVEMALQYLRVDSRATDFLLQNYSLDDMIKDSIHKYAKLFIRKKISLVYVPLNSQVLTDKKWLTFVLDQLLANALKYTNKGQIAIYLAGTTTLVIEDTGIGIKAEDLPRVFEKGFTGYNGRLEKKSTGLGLYLCQQTLKKLSHTIKIESQVGQGTKVQVGLASISLEVE